MIGVPVVKLAEELAALLPVALQKMTFLNTGSEANEAAPGRLSSHKLGRPGALARLPTCNEFHSMQAGLRPVSNKP